jgi:hypothetical protein
MLAFQERNNRLSYADPDQGGAEPVRATVEDKSFNLVEGPVTETETTSEVETPSTDLEVDAAVAQEQQKSLFNGVKNLFRS